MLADSSVRFGFVVAATFAITACGGSTEASRDAKASDSRPTVFDVGPERDLPIEGARGGDDAATDTGVADADAGPETPLFGRDGVGTEPGRDGISGGDGGGRDAGADSPSVSPDTARTDSAVVALDGAPDGTSPRQDAGPDGRARDVVVDGVDGPIRDADGGGMDADLAPLIITNPDVTFFGSSVFTIRNVSPESSGAIAVTLTGDDVSHFEIAGNTCKGPLPPGGECQVTVKLNDYQCLGAYKAELSIVADGFPGQVFTAESTGLCV